MNDFTRTSNISKRDTNLVGIGPWWLTTVEASKGTAHVPNTLGEATNDAFCQSNFRLHWHCVLAREIAYKQFLSLHVKTYCKRFTCFVWTTLLYSFACISSKFQFIRNKADISWIMPFTLQKPDVSSPRVSYRKETGLAVKKTKTISGFSVPK